MYCVEVLAALAMSDCAAAARISVGKRISEVLSDMYYEQASQSSLRAMSASYNHVLL